ncbi:MAG: two-component sensor histidine kinase/ABC-type amino acid transport substrate-binding protein [Arenicella sp.]|jgi:two-component sensor histidine kinase/ABC-type amino acid transport substrate-binding protein
MRILSLLFLLNHCISAISQEYNFTTEEQAFISEHPTIQFGYEPKWEPYEIYEDGLYTGIVGEYVDRISEATGIEMLPIKDISWQESFEGLKNGSINMVPSCAIDDDRKEFLVFTKPYVSDPLIISTRREFEFIGGLNDLYGKKVAQPIGYWSTALLKKEHPEIDVIEKETIQECLEAVSFGEVDAYIGSLGVISYYINYKGFTNLKIAAPTKYKDIEIAMAFTKDWVIFRDICQKVLNSVSIQERSRIRKNWISVRYEYGFTWSKAFTWLLIVGGAFLIAFLLFYLWNRSLKKQVVEKTRVQETLKVSLDQIKKQDREKKALLQEIHHRVKNNLQIITSLIRLQAGSTENKEIENSLNDATERIRAIALIHEKIYNTTDLNYVSADEYISALANDIIRSMSGGKKVDLALNTDANSLDLKAIVPLALILNELITNSVKYGFVNKEKGQIRIDLREVGKSLELLYADDGKWLYNPESKNFGTSLISIFTDQLEGSFDLEKTDNGTTYTFNFSSYQ